MLDCAAQAARLRGAGSSAGGRSPEYKARWEEPPTTEKMAQVERLVKEIADLSAQGLTGAAVALSFYKRLTVGVSYA